MKQPSYLHNPQACSCEHGVAVNCPRNKNCPACMAHHRAMPEEPHTACERRALAEFGTLEFGEE